VKKTPTNNWVKPISLKTRNSYCLYIVACTDIFNCVSSNYLSTSYHFNWGRKHGFKRIRFNFEVLNCVDRIPYLMIFLAILRNLIFCRHFLTIFRTFYRHFSRHLTVFLNLRIRFLSTLYPNVKYADRSPRFADEHNIGGWGSGPPLDPPPSLRPWRYGIIVSRLTVYNDKRDTVSGIYGRTGLWPRYLTLLE
jgi:hypothetical protein